MNGNISIENDQYIYKQGIRPKTIANVITAMNNAYLKFPSFDTPFVIV